MKTILTILTFLSAALLLYSCSKSNEEDLSNSGGITCNTTNMRYSIDVRSILQSNCYSCHGNGLSNGAVILDTYAGVKTVADNGKMIGAITHAAGFTPMPQGSAKLSDCNINKIKSWIAAGALNN